MDIGKRSGYYKECGKHKKTEKVFVGYGWSCKYCVEDRRLKIESKFIDKSLKIHKSKYDYSKVHHKRNDEKVIIICPKHGDFLQTFSNHVRGQGCDKCLNESLTFTSHKAIEIFKKVHGNTYDYSKVEYVNDKVPVLIICKKHGDFLQKPNKHKNGQGCNKCRLSHGERKIMNFLINNKIEYTHQKNFLDLFGKKTKQRYKFDFYIEKFNLCIEYDGEIHFMPRRIGGITLEEAKQNFKKVKKHDEIKNNYCVDNNINLLRISYLDLKNIEQVLRKEFIKWQKEKSK